MYNSLLPPNDAVRKKNKNILEYLFRSVSSQLKKYRLWKQEIQLFRPFPKLKIA